MGNPQEASHRKGPQTEVPTTVSIPSKTELITDAPMFHDCFVTRVLLVMAPSKETMEHYHNFTHMKFRADTTVPLTYLRLKIPIHYRNLFFNEKSATHTLHLRNALNEPAVIPIHDVVLVAQCLNLRQIITHQTPISGNRKPSWLVENVPDLDSVGILLKWL